MGRQHQINRMNSYNDLPLRRHHKYHLVINIINVIIFFIITNRGGFLRCNWTGHVFLGCGCSWSTCSLLLEPGRRWSENATVDMWTRWKNGRTWIVTACMWISRRHRLLSLLQLVPHRLEAFTAGICLIKTQCRLQLVSWSLTSPFSTNMAIAETKSRGGS